MKHCISLWSRADVLAGTVCFYERANVSVAVMIRHAPRCLSKQAGMLNQALTEEYTQA